MRNDIKKRVRTRSAPSMARSGALKQVPALTRGIAVLRLLGKSSRAMRMIEIAKAIGLVPSTCLHTLRVLTDEELVSFDDMTKTYSLDAGVLRIAAPLLKRDGLVARVQPELDRVAQQFSVLAMVVKIVAQKHFVVIATSRSEDCAISIDIGTRAPALASATGRCVAAFSDISVDELHRAFQSLKWDRSPSFNEWLEEIEQTRANGFGIDDGAAVTGLTTISTPIYSSNGRMTLGISIVGFSEQLRNIGIKRLAERAHSVAATVGEFAKL
jgi:DNA-binding IclR family transcriptional regulator